MNLASLQTADVDDPVALRHSGAQWLSLALIDARNRTLRWLTAFDDFVPADRAAIELPAAWRVGQVAWFQEYWIGRHLQRNRGRNAEPGSLRLASIEPQADAWFAARPLADSPSALASWGPNNPCHGGLRDYLVATLDSTLELLEKCGDSDDELYAYRIALLHEDRVVEALAALARAVDLPLPAGDALMPQWPAHGRRQPLGFASQSITLGMPGTSFAPDNERPAADVAVAEFEIDAQPVCWAQYAEFASDGGYDEPQWWSRTGWEWVQASGRRAPRYVEQLAGSVLLHRQGQMQRAAQGQSVLHANAHEAEAFCRWAGRRLPTEAEWAVAVRESAAKGFAWGDAFEWVAGTARAWPGQSNGPAALDVPPQGADWRVLRGASRATVPRQRHAQARRYALAQRDDLFCSFRSCAL